jgi:hypothetical protein
MFARWIVVFWGADLRYHEGMKFSLLALFGFVTIAAIMVRYPELCAVCAGSIVLLLGVAAVAGILLVALATTVLCPIIALIRKIRERAKPPALIVEGQSPRSV